MVLGCVAAGISATISSITFAMPQLPCSRWMRNICNLRALVLSLLISASFRAAAADWVLIVGPHDTPPPGAWIYYDADGILISGQIRRAWIKIDFRPHTERGTEPNSSKYLKALAYLTAFNCGDSTRRLEVTTGYYEDGTVDTNEEKTDSAAWDRIVPDTTAYKEMQIICSWKKHFWDF
jgi:hypothetical protein